MSQQILKYCPSRVIRILISVSIIAPEVITSGVFADESPPNVVAPRIDAETHSGNSVKRSFILEWQDLKRERALPVKIYMPSSGDNWPIIVFSHGLGGNHSGYSHYGNLWSENGFLCVHLQHDGSDSGVLQKGAGLANMKKLEAAAADPRNAINRARDVSFAIDQLTIAHEQGGEGDLKRLQGKLNLKRIGMAGHSFGANTTMLVCGLQSSLRTQVMPSLTDPRITAAIAMSIPVNRIDQDALTRMYSDVKVPILHLTGTNDTSPFDLQGPEARQLPFEYCPQADQILIVFKDGDHAVFAATPETTRTRGKLLSRIRPEAKNYTTIQPIVLQTTTHFWKKWLKDDPSSSEWLANLLTDCVGDAGVVKYKTSK